MIPIGKRKKEYINMINEYLKQKLDDEDDVPTLAGLAVFLDIEKEALFDWKNKGGKALRGAIIRAENMIEHYFISRSALKKINNSTAHFYLNSAFNYAKTNAEAAQDGQNEFTLKISVDKGENSIEN